MGSRLSIALLVAAAFCESCAGSAAMKTLHLEDQGTIVTVRPGQAFAVDLPAQFGTGFLWRPRPSDLVDVRTTQSSGSADRPGASELEHIEFVAKRAGSVDLVIEYLQPFDQTKPPAKRFHISVKIEQ